MSDDYTSCFVTHDQGLLLHWRKALKSARQSAFDSYQGFVNGNIATPCVVWLDTSTPNRPLWSDVAWRAAINRKHIRVVAASSNPNDNEAMEALDAGCVGYCQAFSNDRTLKSIRAVVEAGQVWIGQSLMQRLLRNVKHVASNAQTDDSQWKGLLTPREFEIATLAGNGASNAAIAEQCRISERTVKAHLSAVFEKLNVTDRLQLALRIHGIH